MATTVKKGFKRIILDIKDIIEEPIDNIFYFPDEEDITNGYALIIGPEDTPYQYGYYFFKIKFFEDTYPFSPPKVTFLTNNGITRFNPNLYKNGKVCLSILNTWEGEPWSSCQTLRTILITIQSILNENPLLNEPGINKNRHSTYISRYNKIITYENLNFSIYNYLSNQKNIPFPVTFHNDVYSIILEKFNENKIKIMDIIDKKTKETFSLSSVLTIPCYSGEVNIDYENLKNKFSNLN